MDSITEMKGQCS